VGATPVLVAPIGGARVVVDAIEGFPGYTGATLADIALGAEVAVGAGKGVGLEDATR